MSLNWKFTDTEVLDKLEDNTNENGITNCLIWGCMIADLGEITKDNISEWLVRGHMLKQVGLALGRRANDDGEIEEWVPSVEDLQARIGLVTNVSTTTRAQFRKKVIKILERDADTFAVNKLKEVKV